MPNTIEDKIHFLYRNKIALWDVLESCYIEGADDSSIKKPIANDINQLLIQTKIKSIYTTGKKAYQLYNQLCFKETAVEAILLPSTSPANCRLKYEELFNAYKVLINDKN